MEYLDLYYIENDKLTGKTIVRGGEVPEGRYFNVVICYMENSNGEFLIQRASIQKGHKCSSTGGHVQAGQTLNEAMVREIKEEIGIDKEGDDLDIGFNSKYVIDVLKAIDDEEIMMNFKNSISPCVISPVEGREFEYLVLPVRIPNI